MERLILQHHVMNEQYDQYLCQLLRRDHDVTKIFVLSSMNRVSTKEKFARIYVIQKIILFHEMYS